MAVTAIRVLSLNLLLFRLGIKQSVASTTGTPSLPSQMKSEVIDPLYQALFEGQVLSRVQERAGCHLKGKGEQNWSIYGHQNKGFSGNQIKHSIN